MTEPEQYEVDEQRLVEEDGPEPEDGGMVGVVEADPADVAEQRRPAPLDGDRDG